jgi:protein-L-isoaspartate(D-aspartate) O-methyltransferase
MTVWFRSERGHGRDAMPIRNKRLDEAHALYARMMAAASGSSDPRLERIFELVPREAFLPPGPWHIMVEHRLVETPSADPALLYQNALVVLDRQKGINNGEPFLHAAWIGAVAPGAGETVTQVGAGGGYYTAILSMLVLPDGKVVAYELDATLAQAAQENLAPFENVSVVHENAVEVRLPPSDVIYVNAGVVAPPLQWLDALKPGGRLVFPWRPAHGIGLAVLATRQPNGFALRILGGAWFIPCSGASDEAITVKQPAQREARRARSIVLSQDRAPDASAVAVYPDLWFSSHAPGKAQAG